MKFFRPQYSLLTLLILVAVVAVGTKWWMGPHREVVLKEDFGYDHWLLSCYGVDAESCYEYEYVNTLQGKYYHSVTTRTLPNIQANAVNLQIFNEYQRSDIRIDFMTYAHDRQLEYLQKLQAEHPQQDCLRCIIIRFSHLDCEYWIGSIPNDGKYYINGSLYNKVPPFEAVYLSRKCKLYRLTKLLYEVPLVGLQMQEIQLADVSPELRPRVEEELNKLKAE